MKLHILPPSPNCQSCVAVIKYLGLKNIEIVNAYGKTRKPEFLAINPCHTTPCLEFDDGTALWESSAILRYLCRSSPKGDKLYPSDLNSASKIDMVMDWRQTSMYPCLPAIGYVLFGLRENDDEEARKQLKALKDEHFEILLNVFLKDHKFIYSDTPTIADLSVAPALTMIKVRGKFWEALPQEVKDYYARVLDEFPDAKESFDILGNMCSEYSGDGANTGP